MVVCPCGVCPLPKPRHNVNHDGLKPIIIAIEPP